MRLCKAIGSTGKYVDALNTSMSQVTGRKGIVNNWDTYILDIPAGQKTPRKLVNRAVKELDSQFRQSGVNNAFFKDNLPSVTENQWKSLSKAERINLLQPVADSKLLANRPELNGVL